MTPVHFRVLIAASALATRVLGLGVVLEGAAVNRLLLSHGVAVVHELQLALRPRLYLVILDDVLGHVLLQVLLRLREGARLMLLSIS